MGQITLLEVCVDSFASAMAAVRGGADRLELCGCLQVGGLTPDPALLEQIRRETAIPIRCLMRPRFGDFCYSDRELELLQAQIPRLREAGADGFVFGCLTPDGCLDTANLRPLLESAHGLGLTLHRAFDMARDPVEALEAAAQLGFDTVLTSGQAKDCWTGRTCISDLLRLELPIEIMAGGGVNAEVIHRMTDRMDLRCFHMSGKAVRGSAMVFRRPGVPMGLPGLDEFSIWQTDEEAVRAAAQCLRQKYKEDTPF